MTLSDRIADVRRKAPRMTRAEFIAQYDVSLTGAEKTHYGLKIGERKKFAVPCDCGDEGCAGWGMVSDEQLGDHFELYYWPDSSTASPDLTIQMADRIEELEKALKPFANTWAGGILEGEWPTSDDYKAASRALNGEKP